MNRKEEIAQASYDWTGEYSNSDFNQGAEWADKTMLDKVCEYIANNMRCDGYTLQTKAKFIRDLRKTMEK